MGLVTYNGRSDWLANAAGRHAEPVLGSPAGEMGRGRKIAIAAALATALAVLPAGAAQATFPGENGKIAFSGRMATDTSNEIYTINPDGTDLTRLTDSPGEDTDPTWSPDGTKLAFASERDAHRVWPPLHGDLLDERRRLARRPA